MVIVKEMEVCILGGDGVQSRADGMGKSTGEGEDGVESKEEGCVGI